VIDAHTLAHPQMNGVCLFERCARRFQITLLQQKVAEFRQSESQAGRVIDGAKDLHAFRQQRAGAIEISSARALIPERLQTMTGNVGIAGNSGKIQRAFRNAFSFHGIAHVEQVAGQIAECLRFTGAIAEFTEQRNALRQLASRRCAVALKTSQPAGAK
jgi:hypothetical protein